MEFLPYYALMVTQLFTLWLWHKDHEISKRERKDLYDRLQAGTLPQYKTYVDDNTPTVETEDSDGLQTIEDARADLMGESEENEVNG